MKPLIITYIWFQQCALVEGWFFTRNVHERKNRNSKVMS